MEGIVKWFNSSKGFGFVNVKGIEEDIFVHYSAIIDKNPGYKNLVCGQYIYLDVVSTDKGLKAINVKSRDIIK